jgi:hypothetical protein
MIYFFVSICGSAKGHSHSSKLLPRCFSLYSGSLETVVKRRLFGDFALESPEGRILLFYQTPDDRPHKTLQNPHIPQTPGKL